MNILHYINNLGSGGAEKLLTDILPKMKDQGNNVYILISNGNKNFKRNEDLLKARGIKIYDLNFSFYNPLQIYKLISFIKKNNIEIVHAHLFPTQYWLAIASIFISKNVKFVKTEHSVFNERKDIRFLKPVEKWIYSRYAITIAITEKVKENLMNWIGESSPIVVVKNGVNLKQIQSDIKGGTSLKIDNAKYNIFMVGRFDGSQKDQLSLIKALKFLSNDVSIYFAGVGPALDTVKQNAESLGLSDQVNFLGLRNDVYAIMNMVDLNVLSTNHEGLSGVSLESMASGKPFIGSDVEGVQEIVPTKNYLFPSNNPEALAARISEIKSNPELAQQMVDESLKYIKAYDTSLMVSGYLNIYGNVLRP